MNALILSLYGSVLWLFVGAIILKNILGATGPFDGTKRQYLNYVIFWPFVLWGYVSETRRLGTHQMRWHLRRRP